MGFGVKLKAEPNESEFTKPIVNPDPVDASPVEKPVTYDGNTEHDTWEDWGAEWWSAECWSAEWGEWYDALLQLAWWYDPTWFGDGTCNDGDMQWCDQACTADAWWWCDQACTTSEVPKSAASSLDALQTGITDEFAAMDLGPPEGPKPGTCGVPQLL